MNIQRRWFLGITGALLSIMAIVSVAFGQAAHIRWDIPSNVADTINAGGSAAALANDNSELILTGSGTFVAPAGGEGTSSAVTGGGHGPRRAYRDDRGEYVVTGLVDGRAPGTLAGVTDNIGDLADARAGLAILRIAYSDGDQGIIVVSCHLGGTPDTVFEGITASKGFAAFWNRVPPVSGIDANRTLFHVESDLREGCWDRTLVESSSPVPPKVTDSPSVTFAGDRVQRQDWGRHATVQPRARQGVSSRSGHRHFCEMGWSEAGSPRPAPRRGRPGECRPHTGDSDRDKRR